MNKAMKNSQGILNNGRFYKASNLITVEKG